MLHLDLINLNWKKKKMDNKQVILMKKKLGGFFDIFKQTLKLPIKNPNLILVFLITFFPLFFFFVLKKIILEQSILQVNSFFSYLDAYNKSFFSSSDNKPSLVSSITELIENHVSPIRLFSSLLLLGIIHLLDLLNTIIVVYTASLMYTGLGEANNPMNLKQILCRPIKKVGFRGPLITSICALVLSSLTLIGLAILGIILFMTADNPLLISIFGVLYMALFVKHFEWSGIWNTGMVISILEEKHGSVAIGVSWYLSKGSRKRAFSLAFVFYVWDSASKFSSLYYRQWRSREGIGDLVEGIAVEVCLDCVGNFMMWVGFVIYFYDCKRRLLENKKI